MRYAKREFCALSKNLVQESYITIKDAKQRNQLIKELQSRKDVNFSICGDGRIKIIY